MLTLVAVLVVLGFVFRAMTPEERARFFRIALAYLRQAKDAALYKDPARERFRDALRARTRWALVTPVLAALNAAVFGFMVFGAGTLNEPETLVGWGGSFGPRTTNGEWWRLVTSMFVHGGLLHLLVNLAALVQVGGVLERLAGRMAFAAMYVAAGLFASLVNLSAHPMAVSYGASGAIFGLYGLLITSSMWAILPRSSVTIPLAAAKRLGPAAAVFIVYNLSNDSLAMAADLIGFATGFVSGLVLTRGVSEHNPPARRVAVALGAFAAVAVAFGIPLRGITDVRPEIERMVAVEDRTAGAYRAAVDRFRNGRITTEALAELIDRTIMPELQATEARLKALDGVPEEHEPLVAGAEEYVRLRSESWRLRAEGLRRTTSGPEAAKRERAPVETSRPEARYRATMRTLGQASETERASLEVLQKIRPSH